MCQSPNRPPGALIFLGGGWIIAANLLAPAVAMPLRTLAKRCTRLSPLLAAPAALLLSQGEAKAILTYYIFENAGNVVVQTSGSLDLTGATTIGSAGRCNNDGLIYSGASVPSPATICTGLDFESLGYGLTGTTTFNDSVISFGSSVSGTGTFLLGGAFGRFRIDPAYSNNTPIVSSATFNGSTLAGLGFTTTGLIGTWSLTGTSETIQAILGAPPSPSTAVPGPLPLFGAAAAFGWSRRLRKRIAAPLITPPQA
jgi:hypothetical protein